jgi:hypothetical protein
MVEHIFIPGNVPSSKNSKQIVQRRLHNGKTVPFLIDSKTTQHYKKHYSVFYNSNRSSFKSMVAANPSSPSYVGMYFVRDSERNFDMHNVVQVVADMMTEKLWHKDDNADCFIPVFLGYHVDKEKPGVYISIMGEEYVDAIKEYGDFYKSMIYTEQNKALCKTA